MPQDISDDIWLDIAKASEIYPQAISNGNRLEVDWPPKPKKAIYPLFLPFMGCPDHCVFCAQDRQTGFSADAGAFKRQLQECRENLAKRKQNDPEPCELAFYGGTFTGLPENIWELCLNFAVKQSELGQISGFRCSTRPDFVSNKRLRELKQAGCQLVELGVQTFNKEALDACGRNYGSLDYGNVCASIQKHDMGLGIQLMPGFPQTDPCQFIADAQTAIALGAENLRYYPCLVFAGTALASWHKQGKFRPLSLELAIALCACGWLLARSRKVSVIRMGVAEQDKLSPLILAGPKHGAFGNLVMGEALYRLIAHCLANRPPQKKSLKLFLPYHAQGYFYGYKKNMTPKWRRLNITHENCVFWRQRKIGLEII